MFEAVLFLEFTVCFIAWTRRNSYFFCAIKSKKFKPEPSYQNTTFNLLNQYLGFCCLFSEKKLYSPVFAFEGPCLLLFTCAIIDVANSLLSRRDFATKLSGKKCLNFGLKTKCNFKMNFTSKNVINPL